MKNIQQVCIVGQGYVGLPLAMAATDAGWKVIGLDISASKVDAINRGHSPIEDISDEKLEGALSKGYRATTNPDCLKGADIVVLCVPTPLNDKEEPDLTSLRSAAELVGQFCKSEVLVINESTSFPGTTREYIPSVIHNVNPLLSPLMAVAPERIDPSNEKWTFKVTPRIVSGTTEKAKELVMGFYRTFCDKVTLVSSPEVAELSKLLENSFRQVNIALVNQISQVAEKLGISMSEVVNAASTKPFGFMPFRASIGVGGHCIPVDPMYLSWYASALGTPTTLISHAQKIIRETPLEVTNRAKRLIPEQNSKVLLCGISYKAGVMDLRESPAVEMLKELRRYYSIVDWWDELIEAWKGQPRATIPDFYDLVIVAHAKSVDIPLAKTIESANLVLDYSGSFAKASNIIVV